MTIREQTEKLEQKTLSPRACLSTQTKGRVVEISPCPIRTCFQRVGHSGPVVVPLRLEEHLGLVLEPPERLAVDHSVNIPLKAGAYGTG